MRDRCAAGINCCEGKYYHLHFCRWCSYLDKRISINYLHCNLTCDEQDLGGGGRKKNLKSEVNKTI